MENSEAGKPPKYFRALRGEMMPFVPNDVARVLEVGCGEGLFGAEVKRRGMTAGRRVAVTGVEISAAHADLAKRRLDKVVVGNVEGGGVYFADGEFDCIICNDVLEHLLDPWNAVARLRSFLEPGGTFVASIPNVRYWAVLKALLFGGEWRYQTQGVLDRTHLRFFTKNSIRRMFEDAGFEQVRVIGINSHVRGLGFHVLRLLSGGSLDDIQYMQFAVTARRSTR